MLIVLSAPLTTLGSTLLKYPELNNFEAPSMASCGTKNSPVLRGMSFMKSASFRDCNPVILTFDIINSVFLLSSSLDSSLFAISSALGISSTSILISILSPSTCV